MRTCVGVNFGQIMVGMRENTIQKGWSVLHGQLALTETL